MQMGELREDTEKMIRNCAAREIVDEPPQRSVLLHPCDEADHAGVIEVMRDERAEDDMDGRRRLVCKYIGTDPANIVRRGSFIGRNCNRISIDVDADQVYIDAALLRPSCYAANSVAVAATHIENAN